MNSSNVFLINDNVVKHWNTYSFKYDPDLLDEYIASTSLSNVSILSNIGGKDSKNIEYHKIVTSIFYELDIHKAQILDVSLDHLKLTKFSKEKNDLNVTSQKILVDLNNFIESFLRHSPNRVAYANLFMNFFYSGNSTESGISELNSVILSTLINLAKDNIDEIPLIILTDFELENQFKNCIATIYKDLGFYNDIYIYNKEEVYLASHGLISITPKVKKIKYFKIEKTKNKSINGEIRFEYDVNGYTESQDTHINPDEVQIYELNQETKVTISDVHKRVLFSEDLIGYLILDSNGSTNN